MQVVATAPIRIATSPHPGRGALHAVVMSRVGDHVGDTGATSTDTSILLRRESV